MIVWHVRILYHMPRCLVRMVFQRIMLSVSVFVYYYSVVLISIHQLVLLLLHLRDCCCMFCISRFFFVVECNDIIGGFGLHCYYDFVVPLLLLLMMLIVELKQLFDPSELYYYCDSVVVVIANNKIGSSNSSL